LRNFIFTDKCTADQFTPLNEFADDMVWLYKNTTTWNKAGNGGYLHTCFGHCEGQGYVLKKNMNGAVFTDLQAWNQWFFQDNNLPAHLTRTLPSCRLTQAEPCNAYCPHKTTVAEFAMPMQNQTNADRFIAGLGLSINL
jgi:hypothetical protein